MIRLQPISTSDLQHYKFMEELLIDSFPPEEYQMCIRDSTRAFDQLVKEYQSPIRRFFLNLTCGDSELSDCIIHAEPLD